MAAFSRSRGRHTAASPLRDIIIVSVIFFDYLKRSVYIAAMTCECIAPKQTCIWLLACKFYYEWKMSFSINYLQYLFYATRHRDGKLPNSLFVYVYVWMYLSTPGDGTYTHPPSARYWLARERANRYTRCPLKQVKSIISYLIRRSEIIVRKAVNSVYKIHTHTDTRTIAGQMSAAYITENKDDATKTEVEKRV